MGSVRIFSDLASLYAAAADRLSAIVAAAIQARGVCHLALSGGDTPRGLYERLSRPPYSEALNWRRLQLFFGDERCVAGDDPRSNQRLARQTLLDRVAIPPANVHPMECAAEPQAAARHYQALLQRTLPQGRFDLILLGVGADGHTASLFPGAPALETSGWVAAVPRPDGPWRLTLTLPLINRARHLLLLATGEAKAAVVAQALGERVAGRPPLPIERLSPEGQCEWFIDRAAAKGLEGRA